MLKCRDVSPQHYMTHASEPRNMSFAQALIFLICPCFLGAKKNVTFVNALLFDSIETI